MTRYKTPADYEAEASWVDGCLYHPSKTANLARILYERRHGRVPNGQQVCHSCDHPRCILDEHHWLGTQTDNLLDMGRKGRNPSQNLTPTQVDRKRQDIAKLHTAEFRAWASDRMHRRNIGLPEQTFEQWRSTMTK